MDVVRPGGVTAIATILIMFAVLGIVAGIIIETISVQILEGSVAPKLMLLGNPIINISLQRDLNFLNIWRYLGISLLVSSALSIITGAGLLRMKRWGYYLALIMGIINIIGGAIGILLLVTPVYILAGATVSIFGAAIIIYLLLTDVKHEFK